MLSMPMNTYLGMDLDRYLALVRSRRWLIAAIVGSVAMLVLLVSLAQPSRYQASADLLFGGSTAADVIVAGGSTATAGSAETKTATNLALASLDTVAAHVKTKLGWDATVSELKSAVQITPHGDSDLVAVTAEWSTPQRAATLANTFASEIVALRRDVAQADVQRAIDTLKKALAEQPEPTPDAAGTPAAEPEATRALRERISELELLRSLETGGVSVVESATPPDSRSSPRPLRNSVIAGFLALALALAGVAVFARFDERVSDEDELAALLGAPVLARIPQVRSRRLLPANSPYEHPEFLEAFEFLRLNLQLMEPERGSAVLAVTSPAAGDGKTTVVSWLARSLALGGGEVTAVDLDVRKPELHDFLNAVDERSNGAPPPEYDDDYDDGGDGPGAAPRANARRGYTAEDIRAGLMQLVRSDGNVRRAARSLKAEGRDISETTLRRWKVHHAPLYAELDAKRTAEAGAAVADLPGSAARLTQPTMTPHVRLMAGSKLPALPIVSKRLQQLFAQLRRDADYVLVDTVPVSTVADASAVAAAADGVILVVDLERTRRRDVLAAKRQLANARADLRGIVLNRAGVERPAYVQQDIDDPLADQPRN
jgi:Mrp family chromosome partitioning ATPase